MKPRITLGISGFANSVGQEGWGHDPAAAVVKDGRLVAAAAEERFIRVKWALGRFPENAVRFCLREAGVTLDEVDAVGWSNNPPLASTRWAEANGRAFVKKGLLGAVRRSRNVAGGALSRLVRPDLRPWETVETQEAELRSRFRLGEAPPFWAFDHHLCHAASSFYTSGFESSAIVTWDGSGDALSGLVARGRGPDIEVMRTFADFSVGELYWNIHKLLRLSDEGSLMGLAAYGAAQPLFAEVADPERLWMDMNQIRAIEGWVRTRKTLSPFVRSLGEPRLPDDPLTTHHKDLAASLQAVIERFGFKMVEMALAMTSERRLCMAGGCSLNAVFNGKLTRSGMVDDLFIHPAPSDDGGAVGAAFLAHRQVGGVPRVEALRTAALGPSYDDDATDAILANVGLAADRLTDEEVVAATAEALGEGKIVGWFQGRMEWGPRALGSRSILADPRDTASRDRVNRVVKYRDAWRPFAPSMLAEAAEEYLVQPHDAPFMLTTFQVSDAGKRDIPAAVHADETTRPQIVDETHVPRYHALIAEFGRRTGVPAVLNTSFNLKGEPIVCSPIDALRTFVSSGLDVLVLGNRVIRKSGFGEATVMEEAGLYA
ncbi:MAG: carbamoyltransferase family protein [Acidimicrobiales bacterium]